MTIAYAGISYQENIGKRIRELTDKQLQSKLKFLNSRECDLDPVFNENLYDFTEHIIYLRSIDNPIGWVDADETVEKEKFTYKPKPQTEEDKKRSEYLRKLNASYVHLPEKVINDLAEKHPKLKAYILEVEPDWFDSRDIVYTKYPDIRSRSYYIPMFNALTDNQYNIPMPD